jgi:hypothetical protein
MYLYNAALWCDDCGREIRRRIEAAGNAPESPQDEHSYDSDDYPKWVDEDYSETDSPNHCDAGPDCVNAEVINGERYGCLLRESLTAEGEAYVRDATGPVSDWWRAQYGIASPETLCDYYTGCGLELHLKLGDALNCSQQGDCSAAVNETLRLPYVRAQLAQIDSERLRGYLREFGAWDAAELADDGANLARFVWDAACSIREEQR